MLSPGDMGALGRPSDRHALPAWTEGSFWALGSSRRKHAAGEGGREHADPGWFHGKREPHVFGKQSGKLKGARITAPGKSG